MRTKRAGRRARAVLAPRGWRAPCFNDRGMRDLRVYELRFATKTHLEQAFALVFDSDDVASCQLEISDQRMRFLCAPDVGTTLVDLLYQRGGMTWCVSHPFGQEPEL